MRLIAHLTLIVSILFMPWWVTAFFIIAACAAVPRFYEVILYGIAIDALYASSAGFHGFAYVWTLVSVLAFLAAGFLRSRLSW